MRTIRIAALGRRPGLSIGNNTIARRLGLCIMADPTNRSGEHFMAKKQFYLIVDTETTIDEKVADFAAVIVDRKGRIAAQCAILITGIYNDRENHPLFFNEYSGDLWKKSSLDKRYDNYWQMLANGSRMLASVAAINAWLAKAAIKYNPTLTAYNLSFDLGKCVNTGIDLSFFENQFCLWHAAFNKWAHTKQYRNCSFTLLMLRLNCKTCHLRPTRKQWRVLLLMTPICPMNRILHWRMQSIMNCRF